MGIFDLFRPNVKKMGKKRNLKGSVKELSEDSNIRRETVEALGEIGDIRAIEQLLKLVLNGNIKGVRKAATKALKKIPDFCDLKRLIDLLCISPECNSNSDTNVDKNAEVRMRAAEALVILAPISIEPLIKVLNHKLSGDMAMCALVKIGTSAIDPLIDTLENKKDWHDFKIRKKAVKALGEIKDTRATKPLIAVLKDSNSDVRLSAAEALTSLGWKPEDDTSRVCYALAMQDWDLLCRLGEPAVEPLLQHLKLGNGLKQLRHWGRSVTNVPSNR